MEDALQFAALTKVNHMLLMHHDPLHSDKQLDEMYADLQAKTGYDFPFEMAVEGKVIHVVVNSQGGLLDTS